MSSEKDLNKYKFTLFIVHGYPILIDIQDTFVTCYSIRYFDDSLKNDYFNIIFVVKVAL